MSQGVELVMEFRMLGQFELRDGDRTHHLGGPMQRALLAHLLLSAGQPIPAETLVERLWGGSASDRANGMIQVHVLRLRRVLAAGGCAATVATSPRAYRVDLGADTLDVAEFRGHVDVAAQAREAGDTLGELAALDAALALWRGDVLSGVGGDWPRFAEVRRLIDARSAAREQRAVAQLALRRPAEALGELRSLVADHPDRESLRYLLVLALHRTGRRAEALAAYDDAYRYAADHLGLAPGDDLRRLQRTVLQGSTDEVRLEREVVELRPRALPARPAHFVGREDDLDRLAAARGIRVITGMPGVGKSALALRLAHGLREDHPDGQLHAELGRIDPSDVLARFLRLLGVRAAFVPDGLVERAELFRAHTADKRLLVVLDDATSASQVRALLPGDGPATVIVTSRTPLAALDGAVRCRLDVLGEPESVALLAGVAGARRVELAPAAARLIVDRCGRLPLALRVAGGRLAARPDWPLATFADLLADDRTRLDRLVCEDLSVRARLDAGCAALGGAERRAFRLLGLLDAGTFGTATVAALLDTGEAAARDLLDTLVDAGLVASAGADHVLPDLVRLYAREQAERLDPVGIRAKARHWLSASGQQAN
ncbi:BTAD domain-containing putative transcriptional regulator [Actinosynnema sp. CS-041913]|uniref:AfsR/SARP family transcriptional regulator n=1 Tax=Actinosynnema sp. CS-041913 TaxID=3239917 RepID=UPI003D94F521